MSRIYGDMKKNDLVGVWDVLLMGWFLSLLFFRYIIKENFNINKAIFSILLLIYPLTDLLRVFIIRISQKKSPFIADNNHLHHKLLKRNINHFSSLQSINIHFSQW